MKLFQLPLKIFLILVWSLIATDSVRSQTGNMSDITLPNPDAMVSDPAPEEVTDVQGDNDNTEAATETPTEEVTTGETEAATETPTEEVTTGETEAATETPTEEVTTGETEAATETPTEEVTTGETEATTETPTEEVTTGETEATTDTATEEANADTDSESGITTEENGLSDVTGEVPNSDVETSFDTANTDSTSELETLDTVESSPNEQPNTETGEAAGETPESEIEVETSSETTNDIDSTVETEVESSPSEQPSTETGEAAGETPESEIEVETSSETTNDIDSTVETEVESSPSEQPSTETGEAAAEGNNNDAIAEESEQVEEAAAVEAETEAAAKRASAVGEETEAVAEEEAAVVEEEAETEAAEAVAEEEAAAVEEETETEAAVEEEAAAEEEAAVEEAEEQSSEAGVAQLDRVAYEAQFQEASPDVAIQMQEEFQLNQLIGSSGLAIYGNVPSVRDISTRLGQLAEQTGKKPAFVNVSLQSDRLESFVVLPDDTSIAAKSSIKSPQGKNLTVRKTVNDTSRKDVIATATQFREEVSNARNIKETGYLESSQELYEVLIEPIEAELKANNIDILVFSMDSGLRLLPLAALHDGEQFLVEKYAMAMVPSFGLTDTRYVNLEQSSILAMGASEFTEQSALPTMPLELETIVGNPRQGEAFLNEQFTISNFKAQNSRETPFPIIHLGTHAEFKAGSLSDSYIQFYDDKLRIPELQNISTELGWNSDATPVELLVLSACETALGDEEAELGFAGLAVQAGVKSALASLWYVSDLGTLALMGEFYDRLDSTLVKAEALRQTQLGMLQGKVQVDNGKVMLSNGTNVSLPEEFPDGNLALSHPYFWSSFTLIGNWN